MTGEKANPAKDGCTHKGVSEPVILDVGDVFRKGKGEWQDVVDLPRLVAENVQLDSLSPLSVAVQAYANEGVCYTHNHVQAKAGYVCSRCLRVFYQEVATNFTELFSFHPAADEDIHLLVDNEVDFNPYIEEAVNLALNPQPLCHEDCRGLCPQCGADLNETTCTCTQTRTDPRLEILRGLLSEDKSE